MTFDLSSNEVELLNAYEYLDSGRRKELKDYMNYLLCKQYRREVMAAVFQNNLFSNLFHSLLHIIEAEELDIELVSKRVRQMKELYFATFQKVHFKFSEVVENLDSNETVREFGKNFDSVERALLLGNDSLIRMEVIEFYQQYMYFSQKKDARKIVAV